MKDNILHVQMMGGFSMSYQGKKLVFERNTISKTSQLLQLLLLHLKDGITKENLLESLYSRDEMEDGNESLNNIIVQLRKQLETAGLPKGRYFSLSGGIYKWDESIPTEVDVYRFEEKVKEGQTESDEAVRAKKFKEACTLYKGEFLPAMNGADWVTAANIYYQELYFTALIDACNWLKKEKRFEEVYELATIAAKLYPFEEWQLWRIDSLIALNRCQEAMHIYKETNRLFFDELRLAPSSEMLERFHFMSDRIQQSVSAMDEITNSLKESSCQTGAYYCTYSSFIDLYHITRRMMVRNGISAFIMLCTLTDTKEQIQNRAEKEKEASECLQKAIGSSIRRGDFYTRYNENHFLIMLFGAKQENGSVISRRIDQVFQKNFIGPYWINYYVASVEEHPDDGMLKFIPVSLS